MSGISYSEIVFGLKHHQRLYDCRTVIELVHTLRIIISEHDAVADACERPGLHYHGIIEHGKDKNMDYNDVVVLLRTHCSYFKIELCDNPEQFVEELAQPPKKMMVIEIANSFNLKTYYSNISVANIRLKLGDFEKKVSKMEAVKFIISNISARRTFDHAEIWKEINNFYCFTPDQLETLVTHSIDLVHQKMLGQSILELCGRFRGVPENYYTLQETTSLVVEWCQYQTIDVEEFTMNWVNCLDKRISYRNSLYFQGSSESGVYNIVHSIAEACAFIGEVDSESTGYTYIWEECLEKRCIIMRDPIFDERVFEELEKIFRGIGTFVPDRQRFLKYLHPTPVIVICSKNDKKNNLYLQRLQTSFLGSYKNLKPFVKLISDPRRLHPDWLNVLHMYFTGNKIDYTASCCEDTLDRSMDSDSSCELTEEIGSNSSAESVSRATPFAGCSPNPCCRQDS
ncbi:hypothetical protein AVEN_81572-1 [Araneus ventricosus]|uniref:Parvovirus non-structural protein 1 helicase domain-containing protein n=1 Tax=Araneus ventricosus TaxID=182803 RepID=A0A4Y2PIK9_ARAVE|nr:hypothetical protein AVEN_81572-1 [Araneus ventricosus]